MGAYNIVNPAHLVAGQLEDVGDILANLQAIQNILNGGIDNSNINVAAAIAASKLAGYPADATKALKGDGSWGTVTSVDGWTALGVVLTYGTTDGHTFTATYPGDLTASVPVGSRIKLTNQASTQYFIVTAHVAGTLTLYGGTTYSITNTAITNPFFSREKAPVGFPLDPSVWTEVVTDSTAHGISTTTFSSTGVSLVVPIGAWDLSFQGTVYSDTAGVYASIALTTTTGSANGSDAELVSDGIVTTTTAFGMPHHRRKTVLLAAKATYLLALRSSGAGATLTLRPVSGTNSATTIRAVCAYL